MDIAGRTVETSIPEAENAAVGGHQPIPVTSRRGRHPHDRPVELDPGQRPVGRCRAEGENLAAGSGQPVAAAGRIGCDPDEGREPDGAAGSRLRGGVPEGGDAVEPGRSPGLGHRRCGGGRQQGEHRRDEDNGG